MRRLLVLVLLVGCGGEASPWPVPPGFPEPIVPEDNPLTPAKVELGRYLFYDERLSGNQTYSCASCHRQELAFTDGRARALGSTGESHPRSSMSLANVAYLGRFSWANPLLPDLEAQALVPMFGDQPVELGLKNLEAALVERLAAVPRYQQLFAAAFPDDDAPITVANAVRAIASFERTLLSGDSPFDRWQAGDDDAVSPAARRGYALFNSERLECFHCHQGFAFQDAVRFVGKPTVEARFHNTGLYDVDGAGAYPPPNTGIHDMTGRASDMGRFRAPTLRNVAVTAPYMHDGSIATLDEVLDHYAAGGRARSPLTSDLLVGFVLSADERADVIAFLDSLTDATFLADPRFADPGEP